MRQTVTGLWRAIIGRRGSSDREYSREVCAHGLFFDCFRGKEILKMDYVPVMYATFWALVPPVVAIVLALITKEVYSSLFLGILVGGLFYSGFSFEGTVLHIFEDGIVGVLSDSYNVGILVFLVILGAIVSLMNRAGGSAAFGRWAQERESEL